MVRALAIEAERLTKTYGGTAVLRGVDVAVESGTVFALLGPNGAGKTTLVRILATLLDADSGTARVGGFDVRTQRRDVRRRISVTGQFAAVDDAQTGDENLRMMARIAGLSGRAARGRSAALLAQFDLEGSGNKRVVTYSGGMRRRLDLAAGLVVTPSVLFLDEPTTGLDPRSRQQMWEVVRRLVADDVTVFLTTQYLEEADVLADRIAVLDAGEVVASGTAAELKQRVADQLLELTMVDDLAFTAAVATLAHRTVRTDASAAGWASQPTAAPRRCAESSMTSTRRRARLHRSPSAPRRSTTCSWP